MPRMASPYAFRYRAHEVSRLEAFSDIVFGFALTLIVVSLEVPHTFEELMNDMRGFFGFAICFAILIWIWHCHYTFFRRYALHDEFTIVLNTLLLFLVLFYVYPLKFVFGGMTRASGYQRVITGEQGTILFTIYGLGFAGIFALMLALYVHAYRKRDELELNAPEIHDTKTHMFYFAGYISIGLLSTLLANLSPRLIPWAGWSYFLLGPVSAIIGATRGGKRRALEAALAAG